MKLQTLTEFQLRVLMFGCLGIGLLGGGLGLLPIFSKKVSYGVLRVDAQRFKELVKEPSNKLEFGLSIDHNKIDFIPIIVNADGRREVPAQGFVIPNEEERLNVKDHKLVSKDYIIENFEDGKEQWNQVDYLYRCLDSLGANATHLDFIPVEGSETRFERLTGYIAYRIVIYNKEEKIELKEGSYDDAFTLNPRPPGSKPPRIQ